MKKNCIFCGIVKNEIEVHKILETDHAICFLAKKQLCFGHTLVVPKKHVENVLECDDETLKHVMHAVREVMNLFKRNLGISQFNVLQNNGEMADQTVFHLHFHVLPKVAKSDFKILFETKFNDEDLEQIANKILTGGKK